MDENGKSIIGKIKKISVYPGDQCYCYAVIEYPNFAKIIYRGPKEAVFLMISHGDVLRFKYSKDPETASYKGATLNQYTIDAVETINK